MKIILTFFTTLALGSTCFAHNRSELQKTAEDASSALQRITRYGDRTIPKRLLAESECIATLPAVIKAGVIFGAEYGSGIVSCRLPQGGWSNPAFLTLSGGSFGLQLGAQSSDIILVFMQQHAIDRFGQSEIRLGSDLTVTAGPLGKDARSGVSYRSGSEVYSYSQSAGLFGSLAISDMTLKPNHQDDVLMYRADLTANEILTMKTAQIPPSLATYVDTVTALAP